MADEFTPTTGEVRALYAVGVMKVSGPQFMEAAPAEFERMIARVRRDAARRALDGLIADAEADIRIGAIGGDEDRIMRARAVIAATVDYRDDEYPEVTQ